MVPSEDILNGRNIMLTYRKRFVMMDTKPDLYLDEEGICNARQSHENRKTVDWDSRYQELLQIFERYWNLSGFWDCIKPVSGGKDVIYQVAHMLQLGMNPLCGTSTACDESTLGRWNIQNLKRLGVDHLQMSPNPITGAKLNHIGLMQVGDIFWPEHVSIFTIPVRAAAMQLNVPLFVWGENPQNEDGETVEVKKAPAAAGIQERQNLIESVE